MTFGPNGFFGYSISSSAPDSTMTDDSPPAYGAEAMWWSSYQCDEIPDKKDFDPEEIKKKLFERHSSWKDPVIHNINKNAKVELANQSWTVPKLPAWQKDGLILLGDAAHGVSSCSMLISKQTHSLGHSSLTSSTQPFPQPQDKACPPRPSPCGGGLPGVECWQASVSLRLL